MDSSSSNRDDPDRPPIFPSQLPPFSPFSWNNIPGASVNYFDNVLTSRLEAVGADVIGNRAYLYPYFNRHDSRAEFGAPARLKRKRDSPSPQPAKRLITEENMFEHLSKLQITSETPVEMESEEIKEKRLYMCEEMKRFHAQNDSIIPEFLLPRQDRSCTALVLWEPPASILDPPLFHHGEEEERGENNNNNSANNNRLQQLMNDVRERSENLNRVQRFGNRLDPFNDVLDLMKLSLS